MPKRLLPFQKSQKQKPQKAVKKLLNSTNTESEENFSKSPNLLLPLKTGNYFLRSVSQLVQLTVYVVHITAVIFLSMIAINYFFEFRLSKLSQERDLLLSDIEVSSSITNSAKEVVSLISVYKEAKNEHPAVHDLISSVFAKIRQRVTLDSITFQRSANKITFVSRNDQAVVYAYLITDLLTIDGVDNISINSVELQRGATSEYLATLEINLK